MLTFIKKYGLLACAVILLPTTNFSATSLIDEKPELFSKNNLCAIDSTGDPDAARIKMQNRGENSITIYKLFKDKTEKRTQWNASTIVLESEKRLYDTNLKFIDKYYGYVEIDGETKRVHDREAALGILLERVLGLSKKYSGNILAEPWGLCGLWQVAFKDREEVRAFLVRLGEDLAQANKPVVKKAVLRIILKTDPELNSLTQEDLAAINEYFELVGQDDFKTIRMFDNLTDEMAKFNRDFKAVAYPGEGFRKQLLRNAESFAKDFDVEKIAPALAVGFGGIAWNTYKKDAEKSLGDTIKAETARTNANIAPYFQSKSSICLAAGSALFISSLIHAGIGNQDLGLILEILKCGRTEKSKTTILKHKLLAAQVYSCVLTMGIGIIGSTLQLVQHE